MDKTSKQLKDLDANFDENKILEEYQKRLEEKLRQKNNIALTEREKREIS
jgi:hypothetical protein